MTKQFNKGFFFGVAQCLANGCSSNCAIDVLRSAGVTQKEILKADIAPYDRKQFTEDIITELEVK